jgi:hypothetical protein
MAFGPVGASGSDQATTKIEPTDVDMMGPEPEANKKAEHDWGASDNFLISLVTDWFK